MSIAAGIEMGAGWSPAQGQSPVAGHALNSGLDGALGAGSSLSTVPLEESFRSSWQSVLASLGAGLKGIEEKGAGEESGAPSVESTLAKPGQTVSSAASRHGGCVVRSLQLGRAQQGGSAASPNLTSLPSARAGIQGGQTTSQTSRRLLSDPLESAHSAHSIKAGKKAALNADPALNAAKIASALVGNAAFVMPAQGAASQAAIKEPLQSSGADLATGLPADLSRVSGQTQLPGAGAEGGAAMDERTDTAGHHGPNSTGTQTQPEKLQDASVAPAGHDATFEEGSSGTKPESSGEEAAPGRSRGQMEAPSETLAQSRNQPGSKGLEAVPDAIVSAEADRGLAAHEDTALQNSQLGPSAAVLPIAGKLGVASGGRTVQQDTKRVAHAPGTGEATGNANGLPNSQISGAASNMSVMAHDPAGAHGATIAASGLIGNSAHSTAGPDAAETFAALDGGTVPGKPAWIYAGAQRAEAGFQDPDLGWVGVRADMSGGGVHAALVPGSADAAVTLGGHLAGLNSYLAEQHTPVETLTLAAPESLGTGIGTQQGMSQGFNQGESSHAGQGTATESQSHPGPHTPNLTAETSQQVTSEADGNNGMGLGSGRGGVHISVMA